MSRGRRRRPRNRWLVIMTACILAVPMVAMLMGAYGANPTLEQIKPAMVTGALLGIAHLILRPVLRILSAPIGCLTLGLFGVVIDLALIYACDYLVADFAVSGFLQALLTVVLVNTICSIAAGRR